MRHVLRFSQRTQAAETEKVGGAHRFHGCRRRCRDVGYSLYHCFAAKVAGCAWLKFDAIIAELTWTNYFHDAAKCCAKPGTA